MIKVKNYQVGPDSPRNPLGGREADGFGDWLTTSYLHIRDLRDQFTRPGDDNVPAQLSREAADHYKRVRGQWLRARDGEWEHARDSLETHLIIDVMTGYAMAVYARDRSAAGIDQEPGKRAYSLMAAEYLRACVILSRYTGASQTAVTECGDDQAKLSALRG